MQEYCDIVIMYIYIHKREMVVAVVELTVTLGWPGAGSEKIVTFTNTLLPASMQYNVNTSHTLFYLLFQ